MLLSHISDLIRRVPGSVVMPPGAREAAWRRLQEAIAEEKQARLELGSAGPNRDQRRSSDGPRKSKKTARFSRFGHIHSPTLRRRTGR